MTRNQLHHQGRQAPPGVHNGRGCQRHGDRGRPCRQRVRAFTTCFQHLHCSGLRDPRL